VWYAAVAFSLVSFLFVFVERSIKLREDLETEFGLEEENKAVNVADSVWEIKREG
jgi:hypothetical protein